MAEEFAFWLEEKLYEELTETQKNTPLLVVSLIGKEVANNTKADLLNGYLGKTVFLDHWNYDGIDIDEYDEESQCSITSEISIDVYFDPNESVIWLLLNGANNSAVQQLLFTHERYNSMSFFEKLAAIEQEQFQLLAFLFQISHALIILDQGCRFDLDWIYTFKQLNRFRPRISKSIRQCLSTIPESELAKQFPTLFIENGRIAAPPRLFFCFYRNPLRPDLNPLKKKELLEKMEKCLENQTSNLLKIHGLLDNRFPENAFAQITISSGAPFVYCFNQSEIPNDQNYELAMALFDPSSSSNQNTSNSEDGNSSLGRTSRTTSDSGYAMNAEEIQRIITDIVEPKPIDKEKLDPSDYNFHYFLHKALKNMRMGNENEPKIAGKRHQKQPMQLLTIYQFVETAKIVMKAMNEECEDGGNAPKATPELKTIEGLIDAAIHSAIGIYTSRLALQPEVTGGCDLVFSKLEHEFALKMALDYMDQYCPKATGLKRLEQMVEQLKIKCNNIWLEGHQRCEHRSLTGQLCHFLIGHYENDGISRESSCSRGRSDSSRKYKQQRKWQKNVQQIREEHCSGVKTFSMCNCGLSRRIRIDPFSLKEANFDFYADSDFNCCSHLEKYEFKLFDPTIAQERASPQSEASKMNKIFELLAPKKKESEKIKQPEQQLFDDELVAALGMDPSEFNVRFFDDENETEKPHSQEEKVTMKEQSGKYDSPSIEEKTTQEDGHDELGEEAEDEDEQEQEEEGIRKRNILPENSTDDEEEEEITTTMEMRRKRIDKMGAKYSAHSSLPSSEGAPSPEPEIGHYLDEYDQHLSRLGTGGGERRGSVQSHDEKVEIGKSNLTTRFKTDPKLIEKFRGQYLDHVPHTSAAPINLLPLFPSWAIVCMGHSSIYNHSTGIRSGEGTARFRNGSEFLLPWSVELNVNTEQWVRELQYLGVNPSERTMRNMQQGIQRGKPESREKVKLFIGFDYECPRGHRFTMGDLGKPLRHRKAMGLLKQDASMLLNKDLPIWMLCPCKKEPRASAQLMRIHIVTPKAPVSVRIQPMIQMPIDDGGFFFPGGMEGIELGWAKYYVCRLPYAYIGPSGQPNYRPEDPNEIRGHLMRQCIAVNYLPIRF